MARQTGRRKSAIERAQQKYIGENKPVMTWLRNDEFASLNDVCRRLKVSRADFVRTAVKKMMEDA